MRALFGALSRGTEALVLGGRVPESEFERMRAPFMGGSFPFPVKYGYATVGTVEAGPAGPARPHRLCAPSASEPVQCPVKLLSWRCPISVPPQARGACRQYGDRAQRGLGCCAGPADRIAIVGAGVVGALVAYLCGQVPGTQVTLVDINPARAELARRLGVGFAAPEAAPADCDLVIHASGTAAGLATALRLAGFEATVLEMSWYGDALGAGSARRRIPQPPAAAGLEPGRPGCALAPAATGRMHAGSPLRWHCWPMRGWTLCWRPRWHLPNCRRGFPIFLDPKSGVLCQLIAYS